jgi:hypothetical protein
MNRTRPLAALIAALTSGCTAGGASPSLVVGNDGTGGASGGPQGTGGQLVLIGDASARANPLSVHIESPPGITVSFVTLSCSDECADVLAVAKGGFAPYTFTWEDGSTKPSRRVCPTTTTNYAVTVTDTGSRSGEFSQNPQTAKALLTANVLSCAPLPDGGVDSGHTGGPLCVENLSFEGKPQVNLGFVNGTQIFDAAPWQGCNGTPDILNRSVDQTVLGISSPPSPSDGTTYLGLAQGALKESAIEPLCAPLHFGAVEHLMFDVSVSMSTDLTVQFYGSTTATCVVGTQSSGDDALGGTGVVPPSAGTWTTQCVTLEAHSEVTALKITVGGTSGGYAFIDRMRLTDACPP